MKKNILVIDDAYSNSRSQAYEFVLSDDFNIEKIETSTELYSRVETTNPDLYIVDIVLTDWLDSNTKKPLDTIDVLQKLKPGKPIILISSEYENLVKNNQLTTFMNELIRKGIYINNFIVWNQFADVLLNGNEELKQSIVSRLQFEILKHTKDPFFKKHEIPIGVITAMSSELAPFLKNIDKPLQTTISIEGVTFLKGTIQKSIYEKVDFIAASQDSLGMVDAALITSLMLSRFDIKNLFMIGVCGGRESQNVKIGDIIIPNESVAYQNGKITPNGFIHDVGFASTSGSLQQELNSKATDVNKILIDLVSEYEASYKEANGQFLGIKIPVIKFDEMACGDLIVDREGLLDEIAKRVGQRKLCSVEMESFSVLRAHHYFKDVRISIIKSIMDLTNDKSDKYKDFAAFISANFLYRILKNDISRID